MLVALQSLLIQPRSSCTPSGLEAFGQRHLSIFPPYRDAVVGPQTVDFVRKRLNGAGSSAALSNVCADVCDACCADTADGDGTGLDNITVVIVTLATAGAAELLSSNASARGHSKVSASVWSSGEIDSSDDQKRKQDDDSGEGGQSLRSGKQMRAGQESSPHRARRNGGER